MRLVGQPGQKEAEENRRTKERIDAFQCGFDYLKYLFRTLHPISLGQCMERTTEDKSPLSGMGTVEGHITE